MSHNLVAFEWTCPLCGESNVSLMAQHEDTVKGLAKNAVVGHIRGRNDDVHGRSGKYSEDFNRTDLLQYIEFEDEDNLHEVIVP